MGRRHRKKGESVSLFPFLSILSCLIGSLTLMISTMAMAQIDPSDAEDPEKAKRADEFAFLQQNITNTKEQLKAIQNKLQKEQQGLQELLKKMNEMENLKKKIADLKKELELRKSLIAKQNQEKKNIEKWKLELNKLLKEQKSLDEQYKDILTQIKEKEKELAEKNSKPKEAEVKIMPSGSGTKVTPFFIECNKQGLVLLDEQQQPRILRKEIKKDKRFLAMFDKVKKSQNNSLIFLIRPDGISSFNDASKWATENGARNGKLPVLGQGHIDLSLMKKKK